MASNDRPNILLVHTDQHRFDCLGAMGNPDVRTPHLDRLAGESVRYTNSFCPYPVCTPSRYSLLTGLYVHQHLGWSNHCTLPGGLATFPSVLRDAGYRTAAVGKMHFTPTYLDVGFERMMLAEQDGPGRYDDDYHRWLMAEGLCDRLDLTDQVRRYRDGAPREYWDTYGAMESDLDEAHHSTTWICERGLEMLDGWSSGGNLLMVGFVKPHHPFDPPAPWSRMYDPDALTLLPGWCEQCLPADGGRGYFDYRGLSESQLRRVMAMYYATISQIDHCVGRLVESLQSRGLYDNTVIVFTSDHGEYLGFHHLLLKGNHMYDPLVKVPLMLRLPGSRRGGEVSEQLVSNVDVAPTLLRLAGCEVPETMKGCDLAADTTGPELVFAETGGEYMVCSRRHKLLFRRDEGSSMLFDLEADPLEMTNLYGRAEQSAAENRLRKALMRWSLFDARTPVHLHYAAPTIPGENVIPHGDPRHQEIEAHYRSAMQA